MPVKFRDYYEILGLPRTATDKDIRKEYRKLARQYHPDVNPGDHSAEEKFKEINEAYQVLSDPEKRRKYDELGPNWQAGSEFTPPPGWEGGGRTGFRDFSDAFGDGGSQGGFSDFFESLFGRGGRAGTFRSRGEDIRAEIGLTLDEAHRGGVRRISFRAAETCAHCGGTGAKNDKACPTCRGTGVVYRPKSLEVTIPAGVRDGSTIRLAGQGEPGVNGGPTGDLLLRVRLEAHPHFHVVDDGDLELDLPVAPWEAALGAKVTVPTLDGKVEVTIRAGTEGGRKLRLRGQGLNRRGGGRSDLYVRVRIVNPPKLTAREKELYQKLAAESHFDARELPAK
jgi:curved DNA-binding protein